MSTNSIFVQGVSTRRERTRMRRDRAFSLAKRAMTILSVFAAAAAIYATW